MNGSHQEFAPLLAASELGLLGAEEQNRVEQHVLECSICFESAFHFAPLAAAIRNWPKTAVSKPALRTAKPAVRWLMPLIIAIFLVIGFWIIRKSSGLQEELMRGAAQIQLIEPANGAVVATPLEFRWEEEPEAAFYRIYIFAGRRKVVSGVETSQPQFQLSTQLQPDEYSWKVESFYSDGSRIRDSVTNTFEVE